MVATALSCQVVLQLLNLLPVLLQLHFKLLYQTPEITKDADIMVIIHISNSFWFIKVYGHDTEDDLLRRSGVFMLEARGGLLCP